MGQAALWNEKGTYQLQAAQTSVRYHNGPLFNLGKNCFSLGTYGTAHAASHSRDTRCDEDQMREGSHAACLMQSGKGFVILLSPHPESTHKPSEICTNSPGQSRQRRIVQRSVECVGLLHAVVQCHASNAKPLLPLDP